MPNITVEYRQSAPHRLSAPPSPPIFPHRKNWYRECAPPSSIRPPFSERPLSRYLASDERPPSRYLASDAPTMHNEVPKCAWHLSGNEADYSLGLQGTRDDHGIVSSCLRSCSRSPMEGGPNIFVNMMSPTITTLLVDCSCSPWPPYACTP